MFYRVDYLLAVQAGGLLAGFLLGGRTAELRSARLARTYYATVAALMVLRACAFTAGLLATNYQPWGYVSGAIGDVSAFIFGMLFGLAARRDDSRSLLTDDVVLEAMRIVLAFTFIFAALGKALTMSGMGEFFAQSGYSLAFLKFIILAEALGALGLLLPWAILPAMLGLSVDMFGAVLTHIHNGDPLNDSTGAIGLLIRLMALGILWALRPQGGRSRRTVRESVMAVAAATLACVLIAGSGSAVIRHFAPPPRGTALHR